jgi:hypothetical protein
MKPIIITFLSKNHDLLMAVCNNKIVPNLGNLMISIGYTCQRLSFLMSLKILKLALGSHFKFERVIKNASQSEAHVVGWHSRIAGTPSQRVVC